MPLSAKLVVVGGEVKTSEIKLRLPSTIGRGRGATIMLPHPLVSRTHCELYESDGRLMVRDLGSLNGTFINNERVTEAPLPAGELLTVGTVTFRAVYESDEEAVGPPAGPAPAMKTGRPQDTDPSATLRANPPPGSAAKTPVAPHDVDFNFAQPLVNFEEEEPAQSTEPAPAKAAPAKAAPTPAPAKAAPAVAAPAPAKPTAAKPAAPAPAKPAEPAKAPAAAPAQAAPAAKPAAAPAPASAPAGSPAPVAKDAKTTADSRWNEGPEEVEAAAAEDDDDFNDFLKSLGSK
jgi:pSer/pThr/pTyr-binding forkhead associated (FHA) protein